MEIEKQIIYTYTAFDGKKFNSENCCVEYEENIMLKKLESCGFILYDEDGNRIKLKAGNSLKEINDATYYVLEEPTPNDFNDYFGYREGFLKPGIYYWSDYSKSWESPVGMYAILKMIIGDYKRSITRKSKNQDGALKNCESSGD